MATYGTARFTIEVGRFVARNVEIAIKAYAHDKGIDLEVQKEMGLFDGVLLCTAYGEKEKLEWFIKIVDLWIKENSLK